MYLFTWATPVMDGKLKSCHALELPFMWDAIDKPGLSMLTGDGPERQALADAMHAAWIAFARTGDPGWPRYDLDRRATKRFDIDDRDPRRPDGRRARPLGRHRADRHSRHADRLGQRAETYWMTEPPSTARAWPTTKLAASEQSQTMACRDLLGPAEPAHRHRVAHHPLDLLVAAHEAFEHRRARAPRAHAVDPDALRRVLERARPGQPDDAVLARDVRGEPGEADEPGAGRDVHDRAAALARACTGISARRQKKTLSRLSAIVRCQSSMS